MNPKALLSLIGLLNALSSGMVAVAQGTAFTYQGRLDTNGMSYTGYAEFQPTLWDSATGGTQVAANSPATVIVEVTNGLFTLPLDFGASFPGAGRWLQLEVRTAIGPFTLLSPRQPLTPTPYAITASNLSGTLPASQLTGTLPSGLLSGTYSGAATLSNPANSFAGNGAGLTSLNAGQLTSGTVPDARLSANVSRLGSSIESAEIADGTIGPADLNAAAFNTTFWRATGNAGTTAGTHFVGTTDNQPLELRVNNSRVLRLEPNAYSPNVIGGYSGNLVGPGYYGSVIAGGGKSGYLNSIFANYATIAGGYYNKIGTNSAASAIGGGYYNTIEANSIRATIAGGYYNKIGSGSDHSAVGGGWLNTIEANSSDATIAGGDHNKIGTNCVASAIGGGWLNTIEANSSRGTIAGGYYNTIEANSSDATIAGGYDNKIGTNSAASAIGGGYRNTVAGNASYAIIPGGELNWATNYAFAAGRRARAIHTGSFVWGDSYDGDVSSSAANQFSVRASGGVRFFSNTGLSAGVALAAGGGSWTSLSDRNAKENFAPVNAQEVLEKVATLPLATWNYKSQDPAIRHLGPTAQDFKAAFGLGESDTGISSVDADGVALAAIQGLNQKLVAAEAGLQKLEAENRALKRELAELKRLISTVLTAQNGGQQ